ncbi:MAG: hypothetical protein CFE45_35425, partial [Burkholderiales bacterium PBB5]
MAAVAATATAAATAAAALMQATRLLDRALVVGLLQRVRDRAVLGILALGRPRLADRTLVKGLHQRVGDARELVGLAVALAARRSRLLLLRRTLAVAAVVAVTARAGLGAARIAVTALL